MTTQFIELETIKDQDLLNATGGLDSWTGTNTCLFTGQAPEGHKLVFNGYGDPIGYQKTGNN